MTTDEDSVTEMAWVTRNADGIKAVAAILIPVVVALVGWWVQSTVADSTADREDERQHRSELAEAERDLQEQLFAEDQARIADQFQADQDRLDREFATTVEEARQAQQDRDRNVRYVQLAVSILTEDAGAEPSEVDKALRRYAVDILAEVSPVELPPELEEALVDGVIVLPGASLVGSYYIDRVDVSDLRTVPSFDGLFDGG